VAEAKDEVREQYAREYPPAPSEKPREGTTPRTDALCRKLQGDPPVSFTESDAEELAQHARELEFALGMWEWVKESARTNADHAVIVRFIKEGEWSYLHGDPTQELERELAQTILERDAARNVLALAIERERLATMRADQAEEARDAAREIANEATLLLEGQAVPSARATRDEVETMLGWAEYETEYDGQMLTICKGCGANLTDYSHEKNCFAERMRDKFRPTDNTSRREGKS
jgi:predicted metal-binding protein